MLKRIIPVVILSVFLFNSAGYIAIFKIQEWLIRLKVENVLESSSRNKNLHIISVPLNDIENIEWEQEGKELRRGGVMYDVVYSKAEGDTIRYFCRGDNEETKLRNDFNKIVKNQVQDSPANKFSKNLLKIFLSGYYQPVEKRKLYINEKLFNTAADCYLCLPGYCNKFTPPPETTSLS